jgi:hypothetical protein
MSKKPPSNETILIRVGLATIAAGAILCAVLISYVVNRDDVQEEDMCRGFTHIQAVHIKRLDNYLQSQFNFYGCATDGYILRLIETSIGHAEVYVECRHIHLKPLIPCTDLEVLNE